MHMMELILTAEMRRIFLFATYYGSLSCLGLIRHRHTCHLHGELFGAQPLGERTGVGCPP